MLGGNPLGGLLGGLLHPPVNQQRGPAILFEMFTQLGGGSIKQAAQLGARPPWHTNAFANIKLQQTPPSFEDWICTPGGETYQEYLDRRVPSA